MAAESSRAKQQVGRIRKGISVIGAGNWGTSMGAGVVSAGIPLVEVVVRKERRTRRGSSEAAIVFWNEARLDAEILWICVPDGEIVGVAARIAALRGDLRGQIVVHSSGALTVDVLAVVKAAGAAVAGIAPVFSFPTREPISLAGVMFAVEVRAGLWRKLAALVRKLGGKPIRISSENKVLYHAAATMASPLLVSALQAAVATAGLAGLDRRNAEAVVRVLAMATLQNYFEKGMAQSFSGAFARGDAGTVELHLQALLKHPILHEVYLTLARNAVASLPVRKLAAFERILEAD